MFINENEKLYAALEERAEALECWLEEEGMSLSSDEYNIALGNLYDIEAALSKLEKEMEVMDSLELQYT